MATKKQMLDALLPVVGEIHGGCTVCLTHWAERANAVLEGMGLPWRYVTTVTEVPLISTVALATVGREPQEWEPEPEPLPEPIEMAAEAEAEPVKAVKKHK